MPRKGITTHVEGKKIKRQTTNGLDEARTPGEIAHKKQLAVILKCATYTHSEIAGALGERKATIRAWFKEPDVIESYQDALSALSTAAKQYLETLTIEAVKRLGEIMRQHTDIREARAAANDILDRGGLPKLSRQESKHEEGHTVNITDSKGKDLADAIRGADPETIEKAARMVEELEATLRNA